MKVLVTGGRGMIGRAVTRKLLDAGLYVTSADQSHPKDEPLHPKERQVVMDVTDAGQVWPLVLGHDALVHLAGIPEAGKMPDETVLRTNLFGTYNVLSAASASGVTTVIQASSATLLGFDGKNPPPVRYLPVDEGHAASTANVYALSKLLAENVAAYTCSRSPFMRIWSLRLSLVLGPENWEREGMSRLMNPDRGVSHLFAYVWVDDVAAAVLHLVETATTPGHQIIFVSAADVLSRETIADLRERYYPNVPWRGGQSFVSTQRAQEALGFGPRWSWREMLTDDSFGR